ncbi:MAG TPA: Holliday junction branch migration protein RuvA [Acidimicrobiales bacterium]|nr:Holliday junction branch migration protein RuvA [Acidimicrobiales bacterium]
MIGSLRGTILDRALKSDHQAELLVEVGGVGYRVVVPSGCASRAGDLGGPSFLHVHTHVREDAMVLYGFPTREERDCFEILLGAHGVGPALAVALISVLSPATLRRCVLGGDADALTLVPGIGKKTAARLVLELAPRFEAAAIIDIAKEAGPASGAPNGAGGQSASSPGAQDGDEGEGAGAAGGAASGGQGSGAPHEASAADRATQRDEVRAALANLGYGTDEVRQALARLPLDGPTDELLRSALKELAGRL